MLINIKNYVALADKLVYCNIIFSDNKYLYHTMY